MLSFQDDEAGIYFRRDTPDGGFELVLLEGDPGQVREAMCEYLARGDFGERPEDWAAGKIIPEDGGVAG